VPQQPEASLPAARQEVASTATGAALYVIGGFDGARRDTSSVFVHAGAWSAGPDFPAAADHAAAATLDGTVYVAGGFSGGAALGSLYRLDGGGWTRLASMRHPRGALALVALAGRLYSLGGIAGGVEVAAVEAYDPTSGAWNDAGRLPLPRDHGAGFALAGRACLAGGRSPNTARVDCLDPATGSWSRLPDLPAATSGAGAAALGDEVLVAGGEDAGEAMLVDHVFRFDGGAWRDEPMLIPRHGIQLAVLGGRAWACGGATAAGYQASTACTSIG
jgi:N-acetylneuraminic acid mutarotase